MSATRRHLLTAPIGLGLPFIRSAAAARGSVTFAAFGGTFQELYEPLAVAPFVAANPGVEVFYYAVPSSTQVLATLRRQREAPELDVVLLEIGAAWTALNEGLLEPLTPATLPVLAELGKGTFPEGFPGPALYTEPLTLLYDAAKPVPPPYWKILWGQSYEHDVAVPAAPDSVGLALALVAGTLFGGGNTLRILESGISAIAQLAGRIVTWDPRPDVYRFVADGGARYGVGWNMQAQIAADRLDGRLGVAFPVEGTVSRAFTINLVKGARQPEGARLLISHLLGGAAQRAMVERMYLGPVNAKTQYSLPALLRTASSADRSVRGMPIDWVAVGKLREAAIARWREVVPSPG